MLGVALVLILAALWLWRYASRTRTREALSFSPAWAPLRWCCCSFTFGATKFGRCGFGL